MVVEDNTLQRECPSCHNVTVIKRSYRTYCAYCGWDASGDAIATIPVAESEAPRDVKPTRTFNPSTVKLDLENLEDILEDLRGLAKRYDFAVPQRVWQILEVAKNVITSRSRGDATEED